MRVARVLALIAASASVVSFATYAQTLAQTQRTQTQQQRPPVVRQTSQDVMRARMNENTVSIITGTPAGTYIQIAYDISVVLDDGDQMRILAMLGKGSVQNVKDILHLRGVDMGIVQSDVMRHFRSNNELGPNIDRRLVYITKLYNEELHIVANKSVKTVADLAGKKVNFAEQGSGTQFSARMIFDLLGLKVEEVNMSQPDALVKVKTGEVAATVFVAGRPAAVFAKLAKDPDLQLLPVPYDKALQQDYLPASLSSADYPGLLAEGQKIDTIAVGSVLAVYNWPREHDRYRRTSKVVDALFAKFAEFQKAPRHAKWKEVNLAAELPGWNRFPAAQEWLERYRKGEEQTTALKNDFNTFVNKKSSLGKNQPLADEERTKLFKEFLEWSKKKN